MPDPKLLWFHSTERKSVYVEGQNLVPDAEGYVAVPENLGSYIMVIPGFTGRTAQRVISLNSLNSQRYGAGDLRGSRGMISGSRFVAMSTMRGCHDGRACPRSKNSPPSIASSCIARPGRCTVHGSGSDPVISVNWPGVSSWQGHSSAPAIMSRPRGGDFR